MQENKGETKLGDTFTTDLIQAAEAYVEEEMRNHDGSHDIHHIMRVKRRALRLAREEGLSNLEVVVLAALLHDIKDWKYSGSETAGAEAVRQFLERHRYAQDKLDLVVRIVENISFSKSLDGPVTIFPELGVVQDADRLDAIGAIGIARCFTYGGSRNRALYDPDNPPIENLTKETYKKQNGATLNHFYEKLFKLKDMMNTKSGRKMAEASHTYMENFVGRFMREWNGEA